MPSGVYKRKFPKYKNICLICKKIRITSFSKQVKTCSNKCKSKLDSIFKKSNNIKPPSRLGIKDTPEMLKAKSDRMTGVKNPLWKGENAKYGTMHDWVEKWKGKPDTCEKCGKSVLSGKKIQWANIDHKYKRVLDDYIRMCVSCHRQHDIKNNNYKNNDKTIHN